MRFGLCHDVLNTENTEEHRDHRDQSLKRVTPSFNTWTLKLISSPVRTPAMQLKRQSLQVELACKALRIGGLK